MIGIIATLRVQDGKGADLERLFAELAPKVRAQEPGNLVYQLCRSTTQANTYKVLELYTDADAIKAHGRTEYFRAAGAGFAAVLAGPPEIETLEAVG
jgi:quinol monooxygenase YgiN